MNKKGTPSNLTPGNPGNKGGTGRPPDWLKKKCADIVDRRKLIDFLADVASGKDFEQGVGQEGEILKIPASIKDRMRAVEMLVDRGYDKASQPIAHSGVIASETEAARNERRESVINRLKELAAEIKNG